MAGVKFSGWEKVGLRLDYEKSSRDISDYQGNRPLLLSTVPGEHAADDWENHPQLRKYHETDRDRTEYRARVDFFPNSKINLGLTGSYNQDDYGDGFFGLNEATVEMWTIDAGFYPRENVNLSAYYTHENYDSSQSSRTFRNTTQAADPTRNWFANSEDDVDTYNVSLNLQNVGKNEALELGFDYTYSNTESMIAVTATTQTTAPLPDLRNKLRSYSVYGKYQLNNKSTIRLAVELGKLSSDDFGLDNVLPDTLSNVLLLGESSPQYDLTLVSLSYSYRF